jgi:hypothetical protein
MKILISGRLDVIRESACESVNAVAYRGGYHYAHTVLPFGGRRDEPNPEGLAIGAWQQELPRGAQ